MNKQIVDTNPILFCRKLQEAVLEGYIIDEASDFSMFFNLFTIGVKKAPQKALIEKVFFPPLKGTDREVCGSGFPSEQPLRMISPETELSEDQQKVSDTIKVVSEKINPEPKKQVGRPKQK